MDDFWKSLVSPTFWLSVVVVGVAINLLSHFIQRRLDETVMSTSSWWRSRSTKRQRKFDEAVTRIVDDLDWERYLRHYEVRLLVVSATVFIAGISLWALGYLLWRLRPAVSGVHVLDLSMFGGGLLLIVGGMVGIEIASNLAKKLNRAFFIRRGLLRINS